MRVLNDVNPEMNKEFLAHYGVLGMKWGRRRAKASGRDIRSAQSRIASKQRKLMSQEDRVNLAKTASERKKQQATYDKMTTDFLKDPDRVIATRMTRGEKAVALALFGPTGAVAIAVTSGISRRIEQKQETKKYDKRK